MSATEHQFSLTRAASIKRRRAKKQPIRFIFIALSSLVTFIGCDREQPKPQAVHQQSAQEVEEQAVRIRFREAVAGVKVAVRGNYTEFRERRLALETCFVANKSYLKSFVGDFDQIRALMEACDRVWYHEINYDLTPMYIGPEDQRTADARAMQTINPEITAKLASKADTSPDEKFRDLDFRAGTYVRKGLPMVEELCDTMLGRAAAIPASQSNANSVGGGRN
jgi:hypothetical protein